MSERARRRDRRVYLESHPALFALLAATRARPVTRLGSTVLVQGGEAYRAALTQVPLDRTAAGTTGGAAGELAGAGALFDQEGSEHRGTRRDTAVMLGAAGVAKLRPIWMKLLDDRLPTLAAGGTVDLVPLTAEIAGATAAELLGLDVDPVRLAEAARTAAAQAAREHLPGPRRWRAGPAASAAAEQLLDLVAPSTSAQAGCPAHSAQPPAVAQPQEATRRGAAEPPHEATRRGAAEPPHEATRRATAEPPHEATRRATAEPPHEATPSRAEEQPQLAAPPRQPEQLQQREEAAKSREARRPAEAGLNAMLAVAAINTTVAALPRAAAWVCDDDLWDHADNPALTDELLRVTAPTPLLPRVAAQDAVLDGCPVRAGDKLLLVARHAAEAHHRDPDPTDPAPARTAQLVFGVGPHACPGAALARAQLADLLAALAPYRPIVVRARADRRSALPGWRSLIVRGRTAL